MLSNTCRIALIGPANVGKTVFLTSLINHLELPRAGDFALASRVQLRDYHPLPITDAEEWKPFDHAAYRASLELKRKFPAKTKDKSQFRCSFTRSDWFRPVEVTFYDMPGDRLADGVMVGMDYAEWSDHMLKQIGLHDELAGWLKDYTSLAAQADSSPAEIAAAYKAILARLWMSFSSQLSPSTYSVDLQGGTLGSSYGALLKSNTAFSGAAEAIRSGSASGEQWKQFAATLAAVRTSGMSSETEFTPLPYGVRAARREIATLFDDCYRGYKAKVVEPLIRALRECDAFIYLEDIQDILAGGLRVCNERSQMIRDLLEVLEPGPTFIGNAMNRVFDSIRLRHFSRRWLPRIAFAATKADLVLEQDRENLVNLLKAMTQPWLIHKSKILVRYFACSAVVSAFESPQPGKLRSRFSPRGPLEEYDATRVPSNWEPHWEPGRYQFPAVQPDWPNLKFDLPKQMALDTILNFALTGDGP